MEARRLFFVFGFLLLASRVCAAVPLEIALRVVGTSPAKAVIATVRLKAATTSEGEERTAEVKVPGNAVFDLGAGTAWEATVLASDYWSRPTVVMAPREGEPASPLAIDLRPAGTVEGTIRVAANQAPPKTLALRFRSTPESKKAFPEATESCPIEKDHFRCVVPAGAFDLRLKAKGYLSHYRWGTTIWPRKALSLGTLDLKPGAAVVGWVEPPTRDFRFSECSVGIEPRTAGTKAGLPEAERRQSLVQTASVNSRGFFELDGIAPGSYRVIVMHPGYAPTSVLPVQVYAGAETEIKTVTLQKPVPFEVHLQPEADPFGQRWTVELQKSGAGSGIRESVEKSVASAEGLWTAKSLSPGRYSLVVTGSYTSRWKEDEIEVVEGMGRYEVSLPFVEVEGQLTLGDKPLLALLWWGGRHGTVKIPAKSDQDGVFKVVLPERKEAWKVDVVNEPKHILGVASQVEVKRPLGGGPAHVKVALPDTTLSGKIVDEDGKAVPKARVTIVGKESLETFAGDPQGDFSFLGAKAGKWDLNAESPDGASASDVDSIELGTKPIEDLRLVLHKRLKISGLVIGPDGEGIPGAAVYARVEQPNRFLSQDEPQVFTDVAGQFDLQVPAAAEAVQLTVLPPGFAIHQVRVDPNQKAPLIISVAQIGGTLVLTYDPAVAKDLPPPSYRTYLFHDFQVAFTGALANWASLNGSRDDDPTRFTVPMLEPGSYTACFEIGASIYRTNVLPPGGVPGRCVQGELSALGELVLKVPAQDSGLGTHRGPGVPPPGPPNL